MAELVWVRNTVSGQVSTVRKSIAEHKVLGKNLLIVDEDAKSYVPELYKSKSKEEFEITHPVLPSVEPVTPTKPSEAPTTKDKK